MYELEKTGEVDRLISVSKSDSGISGPELARAHIRLGELLGERIPLDPQDTTVVAVMRGGIFFAQGIYMAMGCRFQVYDPKKEVFTRPETPNVILADAVINTGETIRRILEQDMAVACCVINEKSVALFGRQLYTVRVSKNAFVGTCTRVQEGSQGPDTTMRLFNLI